MLPYCRMIAWGLPLIFALSFSCTTNAAENGKAIDADTKALLSKLKEYQNELAQLEAQLKQQQEKLARSQDEIERIKVALAQPENALKAPAATPRPVMQPPAPTVKTPVAPVAPPQLAAVPAAPAVAAPPASNVAAAPRPQTTKAASAVPKTPASQQKPQAVVSPPEEAGFMGIPIEVLGGAILLPLLAIAWLVMRRRNVKPASPGIKQAESPPVKLPTVALASPPVLSPQDTATAISKKGTVSATPPIKTPNVSPADIVAAAIEDKFYDEQAMMEEARLYITHGRMVQAVDILEEINRRSPENADAWSLLLSCLSSINRPEKFEKAARQFLSNHKDHPLWSGIQALGRTFDKDNPLYGAEPEPAPSEANKRASIGTLLIEKGLLTETRLVKLLKEFIPERDGRFGGFLVKRKVITLAQLDEALQNQQGANGSKEEFVPSLESLEKLASQYDPQKHGSMSQFLASRNATSPDAIKKLLQQQSNP